MIPVESIARVVHEANRALQIEQADPTIPVSPSWDDLDAETRASAVDGIEGVLAGNTPEQSHEQWMRFKVDHGWVLGPVKDEAKREHPLLVPYGELPDSQKVKDGLFVAIVRALSFVGGHLEYPAITDPHRVLNTDALDFAVGYVRLSNAIVRVSDRPGIVATVRREVAGLARDIAGDVDGIADDIVSRLLGPA